MVKVLVAVPVFVTVYDIEWAGDTVFSVIVLRCFLVGVDSMVLMGFVYVLMQVLVIGARSFVGFGKAFFVVDVLLSACGIPHQRFRGLPHPVRRGVSRWCAACSAGLGMWAVVFFEMYLFYELHLAARASPAAQALCC